MKNCSGHWIQTMVSSKNSTSAIVGCCFLFVLLLFLINCETHSRISMTGYILNYSRSERGTFNSNGSYSMFNVALHPQSPYRPLGTGSPGWPPWLSHSSLLWSVFFFFKRCFTSTQTLRTIREGEPRTSTWLSHSSWALWWAQDGHLDFHTAHWALRLSMLLYVHRGYADH